VNKSWQGNEVESSDDKYRQIASHISQKQRLWMIQ